MEMYYFPALKDIIRNFIEICLKLFGMISSRNCYKIFRLTYIVHILSSPLEDTGQKVDVSMQKPKSWKAVLPDDENKF